MTAEARSLVDAFELHEPGQLVAIVGGGGKSSLMFALAETLPGRVILTTTTRIFAAQMKAAPAVLFAGPNQVPDAWPELDRALDEHGRCLVVGRVVDQKARGVSLDLPGRLLARPDVDYVVVEADGSRMRPCKAPAEHEPMIPAEATLVVPAAGIDALDGPIADVAHRPERVAGLTGLDSSDGLTPETLAYLIGHSSGGLKAVPPAARVVPMLNKVESQERQTAARQTARFLLRNERVDRVVLGALGTAEPLREVLSRVTAVVLAAGQSKRMGRTKQMLPWGETTVLGQTLTNLTGSLVHDVLVVTGHESSAAETVAAELGLATIYNPQYADGEMISSLQMALRSMPANRSAALVILADQPMVKTDTINRLMIAYWQGRGRLVAPEYQGRRGNPVLIDSRYFPELLTLPSDSAPRTLLRRHPAALFHLPVDDPAVLRDLDRPDDYQRWRPGKRDAGEH
ncbi:MAG TPA: selenium cofactor biosynthesis protein YqeC [Anaerolineae bacterium]|jgi:molybdenum cofactor cytidylyltransferase|nr:selenium cofactor biosynthesis protein YqeC [Anaerolineae bacterium]